MASFEPEFDFLEAPSQEGDLGTLSHYRVLSELGRGGMGFVFRGIDNRLQREVALKVMNRKVAATPFSRRRFLHEARAMAAVHHDNVATIFEVGETDGTPFMAMEMLKGKTLESVHQEGECLPYEEVIRYAREIASGLAAAHAKGIVHRDIKPANLWLQEGSGRLKILDFGLALASTPVDQLAGRGAVIGTPGYLSPEQARTEPLDDRSDLYSLGVVLYELAAGKLPLQSGTVAGQLIAILAHRPVPLCEVNGEIPGPLSDLIHRLLFKEPRARVRSAAALLEALDRVEQECHQKSDVAETINKLQQGLSAVVSKKGQGELDTVADLGGEDPFAALPDAGATPAAPLGGGSSGAIPVTKMTPQHPAAPLAARQRAAAKSAPAPAWVKLAPLAAVVAVAVIALPVMTYLFSGAGKHRTAVVVQSNEVESPSDGPGGNAPARKNDSNKAQADRGNASPGVNRPGKGRQGNAGQGNSGQGNSGQANQSRANQSRPSAGGGNGGQGNRPASRNRQAGGNGGNRGPATSGNQGGRPRSGAPANKSDPVAASMTFAANATHASLDRGDVEQGRPDASRGNPAPGKSPAGTSLPDDTSPQSDASPSVELKLTKITTAQGRGADTMIQIGTTNKMGTKPSIGIHQRGKIESHHSYLRFDLAAIEAVRPELTQAAIVLSVVGKELPVGATVRLYGIPGEGLPMWQEEGASSLSWSNTPSRNKLESISLLASVTVEERGASAGGHKLRIASEELAVFLRDAPDDTVTLVLAGNSQRSSPLRFVSREGDASKAPMLEVEAPAVPSGNHNRSRRNSQGRGNQNRGFQNRGGGSGPIGGNGRSR